MVDCDMQRGLRLLQFADVLRFVDKFKSQTLAEIYDTPCVLWPFITLFKLPPKPHYVKTDDRWRAMIHSVIRGHTQYDNDKDEPL